MSITSATYGKNFKCGTTPALALWAGRWQYRPCEAAALPPFRRHSDQALRQPFLLARRASKGETSALAGASG
jgi:hypothetical protein